MSDPHNFTTSALELGCLLQIICIVEELQKEYELEGLLLWESVLLLQWYVCIWILLQWYYAHRFVWEYLCAFVVCQVLAYCLHHLYRHCVIMFSLSHWKNSHSFLYQLKRAFRALPQQTLFILLLKLLLFLTNNFCWNKMSALIEIVHPKMICSSWCLSKTVFSQWRTKGGILKSHAALFHTATFYGYKLQKWQQMSKGVCMTH